MKLQRSYIVLTVLWITWFWNIACTMMIIALVPAIKESLSLSTGATGLLLGIRNLGATVSSFGSGFLCARFGRRKIIIIGIIIASLCILLISLTHNYLFLLIIQIILGFGLSTYLPAALSILSDFFPPEKRGRYIGIHEMAAPAGMTFGPIFASLILNLGFGWERCLQAWIVPTIIVLVCQLLFVREQEEKSPQEDVKLSKEKKQLIGNELNSKSTFWSVECLLLLAGTQFLRNVASSEISLLPVYWVTDLNIEVGIAAFIFGIVRVLSIVGQAGCGYLSDVFGRLRVLLAIQIIGSILLIPSSYLPFGPLLFASLSAFSIFIYGFMPVMFVLISDTTQPIERAKIIGIMMAFGGISNTINPTILGLLAENFSFQVAWIYPIASSFLSVLFLTLLKRQLSARQTNSLKTTLAR